MESSSPKHSQDDDRTPSTCGLQARVNLLAAWSWTSPSATMSLLVSNQWHVGNFLGHHVLTYRLIMFWCLETWHVYYTQYTHYLKLKDHELFTINIILAMPQPRRAGFQIILTVTGPHLISQLQSRVWSTNVVGRTWLVYRLRSGLMNHQLFYLESGDPHQLLKFKDLCSAFEMAYIGRGLTMWTRRVFMCGMQGKCTAHVIEL